MKIGSIPLFVVAVLAIIVLVKLRFDSLNESAVRTKFDPIDEKYGIEHFAKKNTFPYVASISRRHRLQGGYGKLSLGMTREQVREIIGNPDMKDNRFVDTTGNYRYSQWVYVLSKADASLQDACSDERVIVYFNSDDNSDRCAVRISSDVDTLKQWHSQLRKPAKLICDKQDVLVNETAGKP